MIALESPQPSNSDPAPRKIVELSGAEGSHSGDYTMISNETDDDAEMTWASIPLLQQNYVKAEPEEVLIHSIPTLDAEGHETQPELGRDLFARFEEAAEQFQRDVQVNKVQHPERAPGEQVRGEGNDGRVTGMGPSLQPTLPADMTMRDSVEGGEQERLRDDHLGVDDILMQLGEQGRNRDSRETSVLSEKMTEDGEDGEDGEDADATAAFKTFETAYMQKKSNNLNTLVDDINYQKLVSDERHRSLRLIQNRIFDEQNRTSEGQNQTQRPSAQQSDETLFCSDDESFPDQRRLETQSRVTEAEDRIPGRIEITGNKGSKIPPKTLNESIELGRQVEGKKRNNGPQKKAKVPTGSSSASGGNKADQKASKPVGVKKRKKGALEMTNIASIFCNNIEAAARANKDKQGPQGFSSRVKKDALAELIASIPEGQHDQRKAANQDKKMLEEASKQFVGRGSVKSDGKGGWLLRGMKTALYNYQLLGAAFMRNRENSDSKPHGGLQSDEMGLGKTVMTIANIVDGVAAMKLKDSRNVAKTTLIVTPASLCDQWMKEIDCHCEPGVLNGVLAYRSGSRITSPNAKAILEGMDVVITTYTEVLRSYPFAKEPEGLSTDQEKDHWWRKHYQINCGVLHQINFRRIILDEAQAIKNYLSKTSIAVCALSGKYRWAISGTPVQVS